MFINYDDIIIEIDRSMWLGLDNSGHVSFKVIKRWDSPKDCYQDLFIRYISQYLREILEQSVNYMTLTRRVSIFEPIEDCFDKLQNMVWAFKYAMYIKSFSTFHGMIQ